VSLGDELHGWATDLFGHHRSLTGDGVRQTLAYFGDLLPEMEVHSVPSGTTLFDWTVPDEWNLRDAYVADEDGSRLVDLRDSNLHVVGYSVPIDEWMTVAELDEHLHSLPDQPEAIPYVTSYYQRRWGFCLADSQRQELLREPERRVHVRIDSSLEPGELLWGEVVLPG